MSDFQKDNLSLEETNALRAKLGLSLLVDDGPKKSASKDQDGQQEPDKPKSGLDDQEETANQNYEKRKEKERLEREEKEARERIAKAQNKRELAKKLRGPTLGDPEPSTLGSPSPSSSSKETLKWLKLRQKKERAHAASRLAELEAQESQALESYDSKDLTGLRVGHDLDSFDFSNGGERILTLRDSRILDRGDGDDELMDVELEQGELDKKNLERKKGIKNYTGLDDDEFDPENLVGGKKGVLSKYDADIPENERMRREKADGGFTLGAPVRNKDEEVTKKREENARMLNRTMLSLDYAKNQEASDYLTAGDVGFKKPKSKKKMKKASSRVKLEPEDDEETPNASTSAQQEDSEMKDLTTAPATSRRRVQETDNFVDDDELAASLARARKQKAKKTFNKMTPEMIAQNREYLKTMDRFNSAERRARSGPLTSLLPLILTVQAQKDAEAAEAAQKEAENMKAEPDIAAPSLNRGGSGEILTFDATSEFVRNISHRPVEEVRRRPQRSSASATPGPSISNEIQIKQEPRRSPEHGMDAEMLILPENGSGEDGDGEDYGEGPPEVEAEAEEPKPQEEEEVAPVGVAGGLAGTLALLRNQGLISKIDSEQQAREKEQLKYDSWLAARRSEDAVREAERVASKAQGSSKDQATREWENRQREAEDARRAIEKFKDYKPDIDIKYHDSHGRVLNMRESWKHLSHEFHGKGHGHKQQEKIRKRIELEKKQEKMFAGDSKGMSTTFTERAERMGQAHMVLSVGARGNAPQDIGILGPNMAKKPANKSKQPSASEATSSRNVLTSGSPPPPGGLDSWVQGVQSGTSSTIAANGPRAGFAPVRSQPVASGSGTNGESGTATPEGSAAPSRFKLAFGAKRENPDSGGGGAQKKRG